MARGDPLTKQQGYNSDDAHLCQHNSEEPSGRCHPWPWCHSCPLAGCEPGRCSLPKAGPLRPSCPQPCARPVAEETGTLSGVQEEFLPLLVPASLPPAPLGAEPSRKLTHGLLPPRLGAGLCRCSSTAPVAAGGCHRPTLSLLWPGVGDELACGCPSKHCRWSHPPLPGEQH